MRTLQLLLSLIPALLLNNCSPTDNKSKDARKNQDDWSRMATFEEEVNFLKQYIEVIVLKENSGKGMIALSAALQGRVMTSSANGMNGSSYGWINREHFESGDTLDQINVYGGEERLWLGPEGGQYSIFFDQGADFTFDNWFTPRLIDLEPFEVIGQAPHEATFYKTATLTNYSGFTFNFEINRTVSVLDDKGIGQVLYIEMPGGVRAIGYKTANRLKNTGPQTWVKEKGLLSVWLLGMFKHSPTTTIVIPYIQGEEAIFGSIVNDDYFGKVPADRLVITEKAIYFKGDGRQRGKIGLSPKRAKDVIGSYDPESNTLTIIKYNKPAGVTDYVNSKWEIQDEPYKGDVLNSYNDGPPEPGAKPLGPFYELESSSPAAALAPQESITHIQFTFHFEGSETALDTIARKVLGVSLSEIKSALN